MNAHAICADPPIARSSKAERDDDVKHVRIEDVMGWGTIVIVLSVPVIFIAVAYSSRHRQRARAGRRSSGGMLGLDELFHPSAHNARLIWEAEQEIPAPAPTPDKAPE